METAVSLVAVFFAVVVVSNGSPRLLFANRYNIYTVDAGANQTTPAPVITGLEDVAALDFMFEEQFVYWTDITQERIRGASLSGALRTIDVVAIGVVSPDGLACDWVTKKLYWVDSETNRIEVCNLNGTIRKVVVWQDLDQPRALALDPRNGYMYWTDWGETAKIERIGMDGREGSRKILINSDIFWPNGLTIDYDDDRMFWTDARLRYIHSADLDGSNRRRLIETSLSHPFAITVFDDLIYWTDWHLRAIFSCEKSNGQNVKMVVDQLNLPMDIHAMEAGRQMKVANACEKDNGGCSYLCLLSPSAPFFSCHCPTGILLRQDNRTCDDGPKEMLLLVRRTDIRMISLDTADRTDIMLDIRNIRHAIALDYDPIDKMVYWTDDELHAIRRSKLDGSESETIVGVEVRNPDGVAVDWVARNLYWTDAGTDRIQISRLNGSSRRVIIADGLQEPRAIVLDPAAGQMYWTDWGTDTKIEKANLDGTDRIVLVNTLIAWPNGLAIDRMQRKLYWADAKLDRIEYINLDGSGRRVLVSENIPHVFGFALLGDFVFWTDWQRRAIESVHKLNPRLRSVIIDQLPDVMGLAAVNVSFYEGKNKCSKDNGGCSHLCLYRATGDAVCACPFGMELLHSDDRTCVVPEAFVLYSTRSAVRMISLDNLEYDDIVPLHPQRSFAGIQYSVSDGRLYWIDADSKVIARAFLNGSSEQTIISTGLESPQSLAIDHLAQNLYWTNLDTGRIEMSRCDGSYRRVLIWKDNKPQALVLNPNRGYLYWSNIQNVPRIERSTLDGGNRLVILNGIGQVSSMTIDPTTDHLFFTNTDRGQIESCDLDGLNRRDVVVGLDHPIGLTVFLEHIYWTSRQSHEVYQAGVVTGSNQSAVARSSEFPLAVTVFNTAVKSGWSSCLSQNGGCSHLCILDVRKSDAELSSHHCACATHFTLSSDNRTCEAPKALMFLSAKNSILQMTVDPRADSVDMMLPIPPNLLRGIQALDFNPIDNYIYWIDSRSKSIRKMNVNGSDPKILLQNLSQREPIFPYDVAISPPDGLLYWSDSRRNIICGMKLNGTVIGVIVNNSFERPRHLALAPQNSLIFWTNIQYHMQSIERAEADGTGRKTLFTQKLGRLGPIVVDEEMKKIFWADQELRTIESGNFDGSNRSLLIGSISEPVSMAIHGEHLYWISREAKSLERVNKYSGEGRVTIKGKLSHLNDLVISHHKQLKSNSKNQCNGSCSHLCIRDLDGTTRCACPIGMTLDADEKMCKPSHSCGDDQFQCFTGPGLCIPVSWKCDGEHDCKDGSDERNCSSCAESEFHCRSGECIKLEFQCNGASDCLDDSDEANCITCVEVEFSCSGDRTCYLPSQRCDKIVNCWDGADELYCHSAGAKAQYTMVIIGIICGVLVVVVIVTAVYLFRGKDHKCAKSRNDNSVILVAQNTDSLNSDGKNASTQSGITTQLLSPMLHQDNALWSCDRMSETLTLMSDITAYAKRSPDPHPTPVTSEADASTARSSSILHVKRCHRNRHNRLIVPPPTTPCSTYVCNDSDLHDQSDLQQFLSSTEAGFDTDFNPHPPTPCSQFLSDSSSCPPSPSTQRSLYLPILDLNPNSSHTPLHL